MKNIIHLPIIVILCVTLIASGNRYKIDSEEKIEYLKKDLEATLVPLLPSVFSEIGFPKEKANEIIDTYIEIVMVEGMTCQIDYNLKRSKEILSKIPEPYKTKFLKLTYQWVGPSSLWRDDVAKTLHLSKKQYHKIQSIYIQVAEDLAPANRSDFSYDMTKQNELKYHDKTNQIKEQRDKALLKILTPKQKKAWDQLIGPPSPALTEYKNYCHTISKKD